MHLRELNLINFRNHSEAEMTFGRSVIVFTGNNGSGKTNLLDAIHYLSFCKSFLNPIDSQNIRSGEQFFVIQGKFRNEGQDEAIYCGIKKGQKKQFKRNGKEYEKLSDHIGRIPLVAVSPADISIITEGSEERRRFIDSVISQYDKVYLNALIACNKIVQQRNAALRAGYAPEELLEVFDEQLVQHSQPVYDARVKFMKDFSEMVSNHYLALSGEHETINLEYDSDLHSASLDELLRSSREKDRILQYTTKGIHKDDMSMKINNFPLRKYASQGQQKTFLIALKLAQFDMLRDIKNMKPVLLLDDIFEKLDQSRITALMTLVSKHHFGQIFITDSHPERIAEILRKIETAFDHFEVSESGVNQINMAEV
ncbi:MAG: DNA replication/repair protein RecF [Bacteroidetes bacterium]|nr:DNA replication/repair protein RecF [Bacteroidota bacterium]